MTIERSTPSRVAVAVRNVSHAYGSALVLTDVDFEVGRGEVHAIVGPNGSGKTTLVRVLSGAVVPVQGETVVAGRRRRFHQPSEAVESGIAVVHQGSHVVPELTVRANVALGLLGRRKSGRRGAGWRRERERVREALAIARLERVENTVVKALGPGGRKFVEIARAVASDPEVVILDEPSASLNADERRRLATLVEALAHENDLAVVLVSHRLEEVVVLADRVTVLRDGRKVAELKRGTFTEETLHDLMFGEARRADDRARVAGALSGGERWSQSRGHAEQTATEADILKVRLSGAQSRSVEIVGKRGEIVGLTGAVDSGARTVVRAVGGAEEIAGTVEVDGAILVPGSPRAARRLGVAFVPEDRQREGLVLDGSIAVNIALSALSKICRRGFVQRRPLLRSTMELVERLRIKPPTLLAPVRMLSGGNQQKVLLARSLFSDARVLAIEEPTHGIDVAAKREVHRLLRDYAAAGGCVLLFSSEVEELVALCDRLVVMRDGVVATVVEQPGGAPRENAAELAAEIERIAHTSDRKVAWTA